jgi:hypothetical protein
MCIVNKAIKNSISYGWIAYSIVPAFDRQLSGYNGGRQTVSVFNHLSQISTLRVTHGRQAKVIIAPLISLPNYGLLPL